MTAFETGALYRGTAETHQMLCALLVPIQHDARALKSALCWPDTMLLP
jgi:hypothetical protein